MKVDSHERSTGMGAIHYTAILVDGMWVRVSDTPKPQYHGRQGGFENFSIEVPETCKVAQFDRSNSGIEHVRIWNGPDFHSFEDADGWGKEQADILEKAGYCPTCGR